MNTCIAVFAYQYREASRTPHLCYADMAFSRTGIARVGTTVAHYDASRRSFWLVPAAGGDALAGFEIRLMCVNCLTMTSSSCGKNTMNPWLEKSLIEIL